jgi:hypothetical protein
MKCLISLVSIFFLLLSCNHNKSSFSGDDYLNNKMKVEVNLPAKDEGFSFDSLLHKNSGCAYIGKRGNTYHLQVNDIILEDWNRLTSIIPSSYGNSGIYHESHFVLFADINTPKQIIDSIFRIVRKFKFDTNIYQAYQKKGNLSKIILEQDLTIYDGYCGTDSLFPPFFRDRYFINIPIAVSGLDSILVYEELVGDSLEFKINQKYEIIRKNGFEAILGIDLSRMESSDYNFYVKVYKRIKDFIHLKKNEYSIANFDKSYNNLEKSEKKIVDNKIVITIFER